MPMPMPQPFHRAAAGIVALVTLAGLAIQLAVSSGATGSVLPALWGMLRFFTIISNLLVALLFSAIALGNRRYAEPFWLGGMTVVMLLVGIVFQLLLKDLKHLTGNAAIADFILHKIVPTMVLFYWIMLAPKGGLRSFDPIRWALLPLFYLPYAFARAGYDGIYPYPFINPTKIGWPQVCVMVLAITLGFLLAGYALVWIDRRLGRGSV